jgi:hypothetical protein
VYQILVPFQGDGSGVAPLTWSQKELWPAFELAGRTIFVGAVTPLPAGTTVDAFIAEVRYLMGRHQALRTWFRCDATGRPVQQVLEATGETTLELVDVADSADPAKVAHDMFARYQDRTVDYDREWPARMAAIRHRGALTHAVAVYCRLAIDACGLDALTRDLVHLDRATGEHLAPVTGIPPLRQARYQGSPTGRDLSANALRHWEALLRTIPAARYGASADPRTPRYWQAGYASPALRLALEKVAADTGADASLVLLAGCAVALHRVTGVDPTVLRVAFDNRFRPGFADSVSAVAQTGLCVVEVAGAPFDEVVDRVRRASQSACAHAYYDPDVLDRLVETVSRDRGEPVDVRCFFTDRRRRRGPDQPGAVPTADQIRAALPLSSLRWCYRRDRPNERLSIQVNNEPGTLDLTVCTDTHQIGPANLEAIIRAVEDVVVTAAMDQDGRDKDGRDKDGRDKDGRDKER